MASEGQKRLVVDIIQKRPDMLEDAEPDAITSEPIVPKYGAFFKIQEKKQVDQLHISDDMYAKLTKVIKYKRDNLGLFDYKFDAPEGDGVLRVVGGQELANGSMFEGEQDKNGAFTGKGAHL